MLRKFFPLACLTLYCLAGGGSSARGQSVFVSPMGNNSNTGTSAANPLRTFQAGADLARTLGSGTTVEFAGGEYTFDQTAVLDASYSGLTFRAAPGANPVFSSLTKVTGWTPDSNNSNIMVANLPTGINRVRYLQDASENWLSRSAGARFSTTEAVGGDDGGCIECNNYTQSTQPDMSNIQYSGPAIDWSKASQYDLRASTLPWHQEILPIASYNNSQNRIQTAVPGLYDLRTDPEERPPQAWVMNTLEGIDTPGEWASLDGKIYLQPMSGTNDIYVPRLTELVRIDDGTVDGNANVVNPVRNITFDGLTFTGGDFRTMQQYDITAQHDWAVVDQPDALLRIRNAENITVRNSTFTKSGGTGIRVDRYGQNIQITENTLSFLGRGGVSFTGRGPGHGDVNRDNEVSYNYVNSIGQEKWASVGILLDQSSNNRVHHNVIENTFFTGIATVGPRQLAIAALTEGADAFYVGREFHFYEWAQSVIDLANSAEDPIGDGSRDAMQFVYNYNNLVEENALINVSTGTDFFLNGQIYNSGSTRSPDANSIRQNSFERNYLFQSQNDVNDYAYYSDSDQDAARVIGNMILGFMNADNQPEQTPLILAFNQWAESTETADMGLGLGQILLQGNIIENSTFCPASECGGAGHTIGIDFVQEGGVVNGVGGNVQFLALYLQMYAAIRDVNFPQIGALPGAQPMRDRLETLITSLGGEIEIPGDFNFDDTVNGADFLSWQRGVSTVPGSRADLAEWQSNFGNSASQRTGSTSVPEPASLVPLTVGGLALCARRRRSP